MATERPPSAQPPSRAPSLPTRIPTLRINSTPRRLIVAGVIGTGAGLGAVALIKSVEAVQDLVGNLQDAPGMTRSWVFIALPAGLWIAWWLTFRFGPEAAGHGVPQVIAAISSRGGRIRFRIAPLKTVATAITLGAGGSAGREGPIAQIGASFGSTLSRILRLNESDTRAFIAAGTAAGISATFNAPIAGMLFALEVVLGSFSAAHFSPVVVASVLGAVVTRGILGEALTFQAPAYELASPWELVVYAGLGVAAAAAAFVFLRQLDWWEVQPVRLSVWIRPIVLGLVVASIGFFRPEVLGTGQSLVGQLLRDELSFAWWTLLILAAFKCVATGATFGARGSGGIFMPSLFVGAAVGSGLASLLAPYWGPSIIQPGAFALVGMAAAFAATARAPLTAVLIVFEATGDYGLVLPLMLTTLIATLLAHRIHPESAYTMVLTRLGVQARPVDEIDLLDQVTVGEAGRHRLVSVTPDMTLAETQGVLDRNRLHGAPVALAGRLVGVISISDIIAAGGPSDQARVADAMTPDPVTVDPDVPVSHAMERMASLGVGRLPVVSKDDAKRLIGVFRREDAVMAYHRAVGEATHQRLSRRRAQVRTGSDADFFELEIPERSRAAGRTIREVPWPEGCLIVSVQRESDVFVASGDLVLAGGDTLTGFGGHEARARLAERISEQPAPRDERDG